MENKNLLGMVLALVGAVFGIVGTFILFTGIPDFLFSGEYGYMRMMAAEAEALAPGCQIMVGLVLPVVSDLGIIAGVMYVVGAYGFFNDYDWAFPTAVVANVISLVASFWPMIPAMATHLPPVWGIIFVPNLIIYFLLNIYVGKVSWSRTLLALFTGIAYVMSFLNGVASTNRMTVLSMLYDTAGASVGETHMAWPIFVALERLNWVASIGWGLVTIGILLRPRENIRILGVGVGILEVVAGLPLGIVSTIVGVSSFAVSLFLPAPLLSLILLVVFLSPRLYERIVHPEMEKKNQPTS